MTFLAVVFTAYLCPGVVTILGIGVPVARFPAAAKPALAAVGVCEARPAVELYDPAREAEAKARVLALGRPAQLFECVGVVCSPPLVDYTLAVNFKEAP